MNTFTEQDRIEQFSKLMKNYVPEEFKQWLIENSFFTAPASIHHHGGIFRGVVRSQYGSCQHPIIIHETP